MGRTCSGWAPSSAPGQRPYLADDQVTTRSQRPAQKPPWHTQWRSCSCLVVQDVPLSQLHTTICFWLTFLWHSVLHKPPPRPLSSMVRSLNIDLQLPRLMPAPPPRQRSCLPLPWTTKHPDSILTNTWVLGIIFYVWGFYFGSCWLCLTLPDISPVASCNPLHSSIRNMKAQEGLVATWTSKWYSRMLSFILDSKSTFLIRWNVNRHHKGQKMNFDPPKPPTMMLYVSKE